MASVFQNSPSLKFFFTCRGQSNFEFEYLGEFVTELENILGYESGAQVFIWWKKAEVENLVLLSL